AANRSNALTKKPLAFFSLPQVNPDAFNHFKPIVPNVFAWEDMKGGGDRDFDDVIGRIDFVLSTGNPVTPDQTQPVITVTSPAANLLTNQQVTIVGRATDDRSGITRVEAALDAGPRVNVPFSSDGSFQFPVGLALNGSADGQ